MCRALDGADALAGAVEYIIFKLERLTRWQFTFDQVARRIIDIAFNRTRGVDHRRAAIHRIIDGGGLALQCVAFGLDQASDFARRVAFHLADGAQRVGHRQRVALGVVGEACGAPQFVGEGQQLPVSVIGKVLVPVAVFWRSW